MRTSLLSLSEELLIQIINFVEYSTLLSLTLVSQTFNRLTTPCIYGNVQFWGGSIYEGVTYLIPFAFLILQKPNIASLIWSFCIRDHFGDSETLTPLRSDLKRGEWAPDRKGWPSHPELDRILRKAVEDVESDQPEQTNLLEIVRNGSDEGAILSILLPKLPNLHRLDLVHDWRNYHRRIGGGILLHIFRKVARRERPFDHDSCSAFKNLSEVLVASPCEPRCNDYNLNLPDWLGVYLEFPAMKKVYAQRIFHEKVANRTIEELGTRTSSVEELEFRQCMLDFDDLERVLKACQRLKTLIYGNFRSCNNKWLRRALGSQREHLENLVLEPYEHGKIDRLPSPLSFAFLDKLVYLKVPAGILAGPQGTKSDLMSTFPKTLQTLHITHACEPNHCQKVMHALLEVLGAKEKAVPKLRKLTLEGEFRSRWFRERLENVRMVVQRARWKNIETEVGEVSYMPSEVGSERGWGLDGSVEWQECRQNRSRAMKILDLDEI